MDIATIQLKIKELADKYDLSLVLLFGSRATGKVHPRSDFDIAYLSKNPLDLMDEARLLCDLMPVFRSDKVDLVNLKKSPPLLMKRIFDSHQVLFCADKTQYFNYQIYAIMRYEEAKPLFELRDESLKRFLKTHA